MRIAKDTVIKNEIVFLGKVLELRSYQLWFCEAGSVATFVCTGILDAHNSR